MARPRKQSRKLKTRQIVFRVTEGEHAQIAALARRAGMRPNELARLLVRQRQGAVVIQTAARHDPAYIAQIRRIGLNLNLLVHNAMIFKRVSPKVEQVCREIERIVLRAVEEKDPE